MEADIERVRACCELLMVVGLVWLVVAVIVTATARRIFARRRLRKFRPLDAIPYLEAFH